MKLWQKLIYIVLCVIVILPITACDTNQESAAGERVVPPERQYTFWIKTGDRQFTDYGESPGIQYLETLSYGIDEKGNEKYLDLSFIQPVSGSEADNFNTLIATGDYMDVMDLSAYSGKAIDLYEDGVALDITEFVEKYMPNYMDFLDAHPDLKATATNIIDGERRFIQIFNYSDVPPDMWGGFHYRRDWIVKYGKNPLDGSAFSGAYARSNPDGTPNIDSWEDNVVFPSGNPDPIYISDWEWMFGVFDLAMADLGITDGYCMSLYYPGFISTGDLMSGFGGGNNLWYKTEDNQIVFGGTGDTFRTYLQAMNTWYKNGWIDTAFPEHTADVFYIIDKTKIFSGKVGLWWGSAYALGGRIANPDDPFLDGFVGYAAPQPINDVYGSEAQQNKMPNAMLTNSQEGLPYIVTSSIEGKDVETLFTFLDHMYSLDGALVRNFGLTKEQYELTRNEFMTENGMTEGSYTQVVDPDGVTRYQIYPDIISRGLNVGVGAIRLPGLELFSLNSKAGNDKGYNDSFVRWMMYENTATLPMSFTNLLSGEDSKTYAKVSTSIYEFMNKNVPPFVKGAKDPFNDEDWEAFSKAMYKYDPNRVTVIFQELADVMYGK